MCWLRVIDPQGVREAVARPLGTVEWLSPNCAAMVSTGCCACPTIVIKAVAARLNGCKVGWVFIATKQEVFCAHPYC